MAKREKLELGGEPDVRGANSEPFHVFHKTRETWDRTIKVTTAALRDLQRRLDGGDANGVTIADLVSNIGEPWGTTFQLSDPVETIESTVAHLSALWVAHVFAMFHHLSR